MVSLPHLALGLGCLLFLEQGSPPARVWRRYGGVALAVLLFYGSMVPQIAFGSATPCALHGQLRMSGALGALAFAFVSRRGRWVDAAAVTGAAAVLNQLLLVAGDGAAGGSQSPNAAAVVGTIFYSLALLLPATGAARTAPLLATASSQSTIGLLLALLLAMALGSSVLPLAAVPTATLAAAALAAAHTPRGGAVLQSTMGDLIGGWAGASSGDLAVPTALAILGALVWLLGGAGPHTFLSSAAGCFVLPLAAAAALLLCTAGHGYRERRARLGSEHSGVVPANAAAASGDHETSVALLLAHVATGFAAAASAGPAATMAHLALLGGLCTATALYGLQQWVLRHWSPQNARDARHMLIDSAALCSCALAPGAARQFAYFGGSGGSSAACAAAAAGTAPADAAVACALLALAWSLASGSCWAGAALWPAFASDDGEVYLAGPPDARRLALVFDGLASAAPELVTALQKAGATATVFVSGTDLAAAGPGIDAGAAHVKALRAAGLSVQCRLGAAGVGGDELAMAAELHATAAALGAGAGAAAADGKQQQEQPGWCLGHASSFGAGPCAATSIGCAAAALGLRTVHVDHSLAACGGDAKALEALVGMGGSVLCLSECGGRGIPGAKGLAAALATIAEQGLRCVSVDELMLNKYEDAYEPPTARGGLEPPAPALDDEQRKEGKVD
jgi:hypothetical protein